MDGLTGDDGFEGGGEVAGAPMTWAIICVSTLCASIVLLGSREMIYG